MEQRKIQFYWGLFWIALGLAFGSWVIAETAVPTQHMVLTLTKPYLFTAAALVISWGMLAVYFCRAKRTRNLNLGFTALVLGLSAAFVIFQFALKSKLSRHTPCWIQEADYYIYDKELEFLHRPFVQKRIPWPESPQGSLILRTNNLGFRENADTRPFPMKDTVRILVVGDSQTDGLVENASSYPNLLENLLNSRSKNRIEILNGAVSGYTIHQYLLFAKRFAFLKPDILITAIYLGNDLYELSHELEDKDNAKKARNRQLWAERKALRALMPDPVMSQAFNSFYFHQRYPDLMNRTLAYSLTLLDEIRKFCEDSGIKLIVLLLPSKPLVEWDSDKNRLDQISTALDLPRTRIEEIDLKVRREFSEWLSKHSIPWLDLSEKLKGRQNNLFWNKDYHLNQEGHTAVAEILYEQLNDQLISPQ